MALRWISAVGPRSYAGMGTQSGRVEPGLGVLRGAEAAIAPPTGSD